MSRFFLSIHAQSDLGEIKAYLNTLPVRPAKQIGARIQQTLISIAEAPFLGTAQSALTRMAGAEIRSRLCSSYRILYTFSRNIPEIIGILHTARDIKTVMADRLQ